jgi:predicted phage terminase large subunit-like protein
MTNLTDGAGLAGGELDLRRTLRSSFKAWASFVLASRGLEPARHHLYIAAQLEALTRGETARLMVLLPPGSAKSTFASLLFPAWWIAAHPGASIITACHTAGLAEHFGRGVRSLLTEHAVRLNVDIRQDARAAARFQTGREGGYFAIGVHGAVTGRRADLAVIDDPVRSFIDAESLAARDRLWNWYRSELITRLKPNAKTVLVMTRWHHDDLAGRLLDQGTWTILRLPALAEAGDPMGREPGEALWPAWEDRDALLAKQTEIGERGFAALFQQSPHLRQGRIFDVAKFKLIDDAPAGKTVRAWDLAAMADTSGDPDWTAGVKLVRDEADGYAVLDVTRVRADSVSVAALIKDVARQDGASVVIGLPRDPGQAGMYQVAFLTRMLAGFHVVSSPETKTKALRAASVATQLGGGNFGLRRAAWNAAFLDELSVFPDGRKDDQVDALSRAFDMLAAEKRPAHYRSLPFFER